MNNSGHLSIAEPCHENWQDMSKQEQGRHCEKCCKVVVDFTNMPTEKVISFLNERQNEKICGRFRSEQITDDSHHKSLVPRQMSRYRIFMAAIYFVFGGMLFSSCKHETHKMGKVKATNAFTDLGSQFNNVDTPSSHTRYKVDQVNTIHGAEPKIGCGKTDTLESEIYKLGEVMYIPYDTLK